MKYAIKVYTADENGAGTDSNIFIKLYGEKGETEEFELNRLISGNAFEQYTIDVVELNLDDIGIITKFDLRSDKKWAGAAWRPDMIEILYNVTGPNLAYHFQEKTVFHIQRWIDATYPIFCKYDERVSGGYKASAHYIIKIKTAKKSGAGTDANIFMTLYSDEKRRAMELRLNRWISGNAFESGDTDTVTLAYENIGRIVGFDLRSDTSGAGSAWDLESVKITSKLWTMPDDSNEKVEHINTATFNINECIADTLVRHFKCTEKDW